MRAEALAGAGGIDKIPAEVSHDQLKASVLIGRVTMSSDCPNVPSLGSASIVRSASSRDADEQAALLQGWNQTYSQMSAGTFSGALCEVRFDDIHLFIESTSRTLLQSGGLAEGILAFGVPLRMAGAAIFCGAVNRGDTVHAFSGREGFEFYSPGGLSMGGFVVSRESLLAAMADEDWERLYPSIEHPHLRKARDERISAMREFITGSLDLLTSAPRLLSMRASRTALKASVLSNLAELLIDDSGVQEPQIPWSRRWKVVTAARELVLSRPESPIGVTEICRAIGVSRRTLQYCFQDVMGISPAAFLRSVRLNGARRTLKTAASVTEAAAYWGFWHFGHFAGDYRKMFGELPSETFRRFHAQAGRAQT